MTTAHDAPAVDAPAANKSLAVRWLDMIADSDIDELCRTCTATWTMVGGPPNLPAGPDGIRALVASFGEIRQSWRVDDVIAEGDRVVVRATNHCTQDEFLGIPATGVEQVFTATFTFRIVDGRVETIWRNAADLQRLLQLGARVLPPVRRPRLGMP